MPVDSDTACGAAEARHVDLADKESTCHAADTCAGVAGVGEEAG